MPDVLRNDFSQVPQHKFIIGLDSQPHLGDEEPLFTKFLTLICRLLLLVLWNS